MKYMVLIYGNEDVWSSLGEEAMGDLVRRTDAQIQELRRSGEFVGGYGVADQVMAKTVRMRDGAVAVTDGPYLEAKEYLGSFWIVDCDSLDRALEIAGNNPAAELTDVEVRPLMHEAPPAE